jgi:hypothetical protein
MNGWSFVFLSAVGALIFQFWLWIALCVVQMVNILVDNHEHRWLPLGLLAIGWSWCFIQPLLGWHR